MQVRRREGDRSLSRTGLEATKQIYAGVSVKEVRSKSRRIVPVPAGVTPKTSPASSWRECPDLKASQAPR